MSKYTLFDYVAKRLLRQKANFVASEGFLPTSLPPPKAVVESELEIAGEARNYWLSRRLYDYDFVLLLPKINEKIESAFASKLNGRRGCVITGKEAEQLITLYSLYEFSSNIIIGSFDEPYGSKLRNIPAGEETIIDCVILGGMNGTRP